MQLSPPQSHLFNSVKGFVPFGQDLALVHSTSPYNLKMFSLLHQPYSWRAHEKF